MAKNAKPSREPSRHDLSKHPGITKDGINVTMPSAGMDMHSKHQPNTWLSHYGITKAEKDQNQLQAQFAQYTYSSIFSLGSEKVLPTGITPSICIGHAGLF